VRSADATGTLFDSRVEHSTSRPPGVEDRAQRAMVLRSVWSCFRFVCGAPRYIAHELALCSTGLGLVQNFSFADSLIPAYYLLRPSCSWARNRAFDPWRLENPGGQREAAPSRTS
jgi:hypothetical protein